MEAVENVAMTWCKIKSYIAVALGVLFTILVISGTYRYFNTKDKTKKASIRNVVLVCLFLILLCILSYYWVRTSVGCGVSIAGNIFSLVR
jgi:hypothetical protein